MSIDRSDLLSLETDCRDLAGEEVAKLWSQERVFRAINTEMLRLVRVVGDLGQGYFDTLYSPAMTTTSIDLPNNCLRVRQLDVLRGSTWTPLAWHGPDNQYLWRSPYGSTEAVSARFYGNTLNIESGVGDATQVRIVYTRIPPPLRYETMSTASTNTFVMQAGASVYDDAYVGDTIVLLSGTGYGQVRTISDYTGGTTLSCTVSSDFSPVPDTTTYYSTVLPEPLRGWSDVVATGAAIRLLYRRRDSELISMLQQQYATDYTAMVDQLAQRQTDSVQRVRHVPTWDDME